MSFKAAAAEFEWSFCRMESLGSLGVLGVLVLLLFCPGATSTEDFCKDKSCPGYKVVDKGDGFEARNYSVSEWISTRMDGNQTKHLLEANQRLKDAGYQFHSYAWPVLLTQTEGDDGTQWFLSYFIPPDTTKPESPNGKVTAETKPAGTVYVKVFDGSPSLDRGLQMAKNLQKDLNKAEKSFDPRTFVGAAYEGYFSWYHHNEIWIYAEQQQPFDG